MELFGIDIFDIEDFSELAVRFIFNLLIIITIVRFLYYRIHQRKDYLFTYILISSTIFLLCFLLDNVKLELGFALGLFAIFGIIRYRTRQIPIKEMTYLFLVIGISVINALSNSKVSYIELLFTNAVLIAVTYFLERMMLLKHETKKSVYYEKIDFIKPEKRNELIADLEERMGLQINRVEITKVDFLRDAANINVYYYETNVSYDSEDEDEIDE
jgi:hypothetical protein